MVKKQQKKIDTIPQKWKIVGLISLIANAIVLVLIIATVVATKSGVLDYAIVNTGLNTLCSEEFRSAVQADDNSGESSNGHKISVASIDYVCQSHGSETYFTQGFNDYAHSLGLKTE